MDLNQHEFESAIYKILNYGDESKLARAVGKSAAYYSSMLNPEDPRESNWFKAARDFCNLIALDPERGLSVLDVFTYYVERAKPKDFTLCVDKTREAAFRESSEFQLASVTKSTDEIKRELIDSIHASERHLEAIEADEQAERARRAEVLTRATARIGRNGK